MRSRARTKIGGAWRSAWAAGALLVAACTAVGCATGSPPEATSAASSADAVARNYAAILDNRYGDEFPDDRVVTVRLVMDESDWKDVQADVRAKEYYKADIWIDDELVKDVAVRTKGSSSLMAAAQAGSFRAGLKVDFNFFNQARSYRGIKKVVYNNGFSDPTLMKEFLGYELMAEIGVPAPRACFADLWVNDTHLGVYTQVEAVDGTFVADHFRDPNGNLYKPEIAAGRLDWTEADALAQAGGQQSTTTTGESFNVGGGDLGDIIERAGDDAGWIPGHLQTDDEVSTPTTLPRGPGGFLGGGGFPGFLNDSQQYLVSVGLKTNEEKADYSHLYDLLDVLNADPATVSAQDLRRVIDVDEVLRFLAASVALVHLDNYIGMGHNYYLYDDSGVFSIIPWDLNMVFGGFNSGLSEQQILDFYIDEPTSAAVSNYPLVEQLMDEPEFVATYHDYLRQLIDGPFSLAHMRARIKQIADVIRPYVQKDTNLLFSAQAFEQGLTDDLTGATGARGNTPGGTFIGLAKFVRARTDSIAAQLSGTQASSLGDGSGNRGVIGVGRPGGGFPGAGPVPGGNPPRGQGPTTSTTIGSAGGPAMPGA